MNHTIFWTPLSKESFQECVSFLEYRWGVEIVERFFSLTDQKLDYLLSYPHLGERTEYPDVRRTLIHQNVTLFYIPEKNRIKLLIFWHNRQDPNYLYQKLTSS